MNLTLDNDVFYDEFETPVAVATSDCSYEQKQRILAGAELLIKVKNFIDAVNSGTLKPKSTCNEFEAILDKYNIQ